MWSLSSQQRAGQPEEQAGRPIPRGQDGVGSAIYKVFQGWTFTILDMRWKEGQSPEVTRANLLQIRERKIEDGWQKSACAFGLRRW